LQYFSSFAATEIHQYEFGVVKPRLTEPGSRRQSCAQRGNPAACAQNTQRKATGRISFSFDREGLLSVLLGEKEPFARGLAVGPPHGIER